MLEEHDQDLTQGAIVMATQNEDFAMFKLLVKHTKPKRNIAEDVDLNPVNQSNWKEWLFGPENVFLPSALAKDTDLAKYLKKEFKGEIEEFLKSDRNTSNGDTIQSDELADAKALYELQLQEGGLENNLNLNVSLKLMKNVELTVINHSSTISKNPALYKTLLKLNDINIICQMVEKLPTVNIKLDIYHSSPLHLAAQKGSTELVKVLISNGANLEAKTNKGW